MGVNESRQDGGFAEVLDARFRPLNGDLCAAADANYLGSIDGHRAPLNRRRDDWQNPTG